MLSSALVSILDIGPRYLTALLFIGGFVPYLISLHLVEPWLMKMYVSRHNSQ